MTCVIGMIKDNKMYMAADSAGTDETDLIVRKDVKVFVRDKMLIGFTDSFRMGQLLQYKLKIPKQPVKMNDHEYMVTLFIDAVRKCLKTGGFAKKDNEEESAGSFLVGYKNMIYEVESDYQVGISSRPYASCGCGSSYALGAMEALNNAGFDYHEMQPVDMIRAALTTAESYSAGVRGPFKILVL